MVSILDRNVLDLFQTAWFCDLIGLFTDLFHTGTFVHHRRERKDRIEEMRRNGILIPPATYTSRSTASISTIIHSPSTTKLNRDLPTWTISENQANNEAHTCVVSCSL